MTFRSSDEKTIRYFHKRGVEIRIHRRDFNGESIRYVEVLPAYAADAASLLLFVHGAPGSSGDYYRFLADETLRRRARLVAVDRLGYGYSAYGKAEISLAVQAGQLRFVIDQFPEKKGILIGHSFGGPIVGKFAMDFPEKTRALVMLAPVNDPDSEPVFWVSHLARWPGTRWMMSKALQVAGDEKFAHVGQLRQIEGGWRQLRMPVVHIHGQKDVLAPPANMDFSRRHIPEGNLRLIDLPNGGQFIPWKDYDLVRRELVGLLDGQ